MQEAMDEGIAIMGEKRRETKRSESIVGVLQTLVVWILR